MAETVHSRAPMPAGTVVTPPSRTDQAVAIGYGVLCHGSFMVGVAAMIVAMFHGMSRSLGVVPAPWWPIADAMLLLQFPLAHSLLLTPLGGRVLRRLAPARLAGRLATTTYVAVASLQVLALFVLWTPSGAVWWRATGSTQVVLGICYALAWLLLLKSILDAGLSVQAGSLGWWSVLRGRAPRFPPMPTRGLFRLVRQPIYASFALTLWTVPTWTPDQLAVAASLTAYCLAAPLFKERRFRRRFGRDFEAYSRDVPYWIPSRRTIMRAVATFRRPAAPSASSLRPKR